MAHYHSQKFYRYVSAMFHSVCKLVAPIRAQNAKESTSYFFGYRRTGSGQDPVETRSKELRLIPNDSFRFMHLVCACRSDALKALKLRFSVVWQAFQLSVPVNAPDFF